MTLCNPLARHSRLERELGDPLQSSCETLQMVLVLVVVLVLLLLLLLLLVLVLVLVLVLETRN